MSLDQYTTFKRVKADVFLDRYPMLWAEKYYVMNDVANADASKGYREFTGPGGHSVGEYGYPIYRRVIDTERMLADLNASRVETDTMREQFLLANAELRDAKVQVLDKQSRLERANSECAAWRQADFHVQGLLQMLVPLFDELHESERFRWRELLALPEKIRADVCKARAIDGFDTSLKKLSDERGMAFDDVCLKFAILMWRRQRGETDVQDALTRGNLALQKIALCRADELVGCPEDNDAAIAAAEKLISSREPKSSPKS